MGEAGMTNVIDFGDPIKLLQNDELWDAINESDHPACRKLTRWVYHDALPTMRKTGGYEWPGTQDELDAMVWAAIRAARGFLK
jgi:prophage antirepressor-like protein